MTYDVAIIGAGPAGSACAAFCAAAGLTTLLLERAIFPREKVCGDCLNPAAWPVLDRLGVSERVLALPHARLAEVQFLGIGGESLRIPLPAGRGEIAIKRSLLDQLLLTRAEECGAEIRQDAVVTAITAIAPGWEIQSNAGRFLARSLVAADGRNSTVARLLNLLPAASRERVGLQTHLPAPADAPRGVTLRFLPHGYCGIAPVGAAEINVCLVARPPRLAEAKAWAAAHFHLEPDHEWRTITPLARAPVPAAHERLLLVGDAARVVEPFTGEGIYYALATGELAARCLIGGKLGDYAPRHAALYRGRLWINHLARFASLHPRAGTAFIRAAKFAPGLLRHLTARVVRSAPPAPAPDR